MRLSRTALSGRLLGREADVPADLVCSVWFPEVLNELALVGNRLLGGRISLNDSLGTFATQRYAGQALQQVISRADANFYHYRAGYGYGAYTKASAGPTAHEGTVYAVAGSSGRLSPGSLDHVAMFVSLSSLGSLVLDVDGERLDAKFLDTAGVALRELTIVKNSGLAPAAPSGLVATDTLSAAVLDWDDNAEPDLAGCRVFRGTAPGGSYSRLAGVASTTLIATGSTWLFDDTRHGPWNGLARRRFQRQRSGGRRCRVGLRGRR